MNNHHSQLNNEETASPQPASKDSTKPNGDSNSDGGDKELAKAIIALLGQEYQQLLATGDYLATDQSRAKLIAESLPEAFGLVSQKNFAKDALIEKLLPLAKGIKDRLEKAHRRRLHILWFLGSLLTGAIVWFWQQQTHEVSIRENAAWQIVQKQFRQEPGYHITDIWREQDGYRIDGLRDPLSTPPEKLLTSQQIDTLSLSWRWTPIQMRESAFILTRAKAKLAPPKEVTITWNQGVLTLKGKASLNWILKAEQRALNLAWVDSVEMSELLQKETRQERLQLLIRRIEGQKLSIPKQTDALPLTKDTLAKLKNIAQEINELTELATLMNQKLRIVLRCEVATNSLDATEGLARGLDYGENVVQALHRLGVESKLFDLESRISPLHPESESSAIFSIVLPST